MKYINRKGDGYTETVDEFEDRAEAQIMAKEYRRSDPGARYWTSDKPCKGWADR